MTDQATSQPQEMNPFVPPQSNVPEDEPDKAKPYVLADRMKRLGAVLLDSAFIGAPVIIISLIGAATEIEALSLLAILGGIAALAYQAYLISTRGQSVGKIVARLRIEKLDGQPPGFVYGFLLRSLVPSVVAGIPLVGILFGIINALFVFRDDRRCIHDHLAGTRVVLIEPSRDAPR